MTMALRIIGIAAILMGLLWIGQGTGLVMWPASSFMLAQRQWAIWGILLVGLGLVLVLRGKRRR
ncbi:hypothetical protein OLX02_02485 [Novosphingobium sp. KCTC 2891]|uniref:hypothetical protein n=1 Tax=Novosphingobium sp. KCTC 2891 TaxID=2989730 RepID=UPI002223D2EF|nr:hypothetical protein [Novosphingobium sp. KCTC 2891]MCW1381683.1 hypothetical protein [Novosphingobium sp. KCTC 2891]